MTGVELEQGIEDFLPNIVEIIFFVVSVFALLPCAGYCFKCCYDKLCPGKKYRGSSALGDLREQEDNVTDEEVGVEMAATKISNGGNKRLSLLFSSNPMYLGDKRLPLGKDKSEKHFSRAIEDGARTNIERIQENVMQKGLGNGAGKHM